MMSSCEASRKSSYNLILSAISFCIVVNNVFAGTGFDFIVSVAGTAGSNPCPPTILGVGLGGTIESCALAAKRALLREAGSPNSDPFYDDLEQRALAGVNALGIGPQGFGGSVSCLAVHIAPLPTHIAGLPCVVNTSCHVTRHAEGVL